MTPRAWISALLIMSACSSPGIAPGSAAVGQPAMTSPSPQAEIVFDIRWDGEAGPQGVRPRIDQALAATGLTTLIPPAGAGVGEAALLITAVVGADGQPVSGTSRVSVVVEDPTGAAMLTLATPPPADPCPPGSHPAATRSADGCSVDTRDGTTTWWTESDRRYQLDVAAGAPVPEGWIATWQVAP